MRQAAVGAVVTIAPYDWGRRKEPAPREGDFLRSTGGTVYAIVEAVETRRPGRWRLRCVKLGRDAELPDGARVARLSWYPRKRKRP